MPPDGVRESSCEDPVKKMNISKNQDNNHGRCRDHHQFVGKKRTNSKLFKEEVCEDDKRKSGRYEDQEGQDEEDDNDLTSSDPNQELFS